MTIAICYYCADGVVFGADTLSFTSDFTHTEHEGKIFDLGLDPQVGSVGLVGYGLAGFGATLPVRLIVDGLRRSLVRYPQKKLFDAVDLWSTAVHAEFKKVFDHKINRYRRLAAGQRLSQTEADELADLENYQGGFLVGGRLVDDPETVAFEINYGVANADQATFGSLNKGQIVTRGFDTIVNRILYGYDDVTFNSILSSNSWSGGRQDLHGVLTTWSGHPRKLPNTIDAVPFVRFLVDTSIRCVEFSGDVPFCGGNTWIATVSDNQPFRLSHK